MENIKNFISSNKVLIGIVLALVILYIMKDDVKSLTSKATGYTPPSDTSSTSDTSMILKNGVRGVEVKKLQSYINDDRSGEAIAEDGIFGRITEGALYDVIQKKETTLMEYTALTSSPSLSTANGLPNGAQNLTAPVAFVQEEN